MEVVVRDAVTRAEERTLMCVNKRSGRGAGGGDMINVVEGSRIEAVHMKESVMARMKDGVTEDALARKVLLPPRKIPEKRRIEVGFRCIF